MATVNSEIKRIIREKEAGIRSGTEAMLGILKELQAQVLSELGQAAIGSWDMYSQKQLLQAIETQIEVFTAKAQASAGDLLDKAWDMGQTLAATPLELAGLYTGFHISASSVEAMALKEFTANITKDLFGNAWTKIRGEITLGILGSKTPQQVAEAIGRSLKGKSIFSSIAERAEVITKTEMGRAFSMATQLRLKEAAKHVEGLEKQWLHAGHPKHPRDSHLWADKTHVPVDRPFNIGGVMMMYPRDPAAPIKEVIHCGCSHAGWHARWAE